MFRLCLLTAVALCGCYSFAADRSNQPNIVVIYSDDHGFTDLGCQGIRDDLKTPYIDDLAAGGVRMQAGYVSAPQCVPSRAGLLSGRYQNRIGVESNGELLDGFNAEQTIAERLKKSGYATGMIGKWHLGPPAAIVSHGFDDVYYKNSNRPGWANFNLDGSDREPGTEDSSLYHLDANTDATCAFIKRHHEQPFFFYCAYRAPHVPLDAPEKYLKRFPGEMPERRRQALAMISAMDDGVGKIMATLRRHQLEENTLVFFVGDNGAPLKIQKVDAPGGGPGWDGSLNEPLNGEKGMLTEGGIRVPFVASWKGQFKAGQVYEHPVISLDIAATAVSLAGLPADDKLDGVDLTPYLSGKQKGAPHETLYWRWIAQAAIRDGNWKYLRGGDRDYLFNVADDREEKRDLLKQHPEIVRKLSAKLASWAQELKPPGLTTKPMAETWEHYFDHYLEGKTVKTMPRKPGSTPLQGWIVRNGTANAINGALKVTGDEGKKAQPFVAAAGLKLPGPVTAIVRLRSTRGGSASIAWRNDGQKEFAAGQVATFSCEASDQFQTHRVTIPTTGTIVHLRILPPAKEAAISSIEIQNATGSTIKLWNFAR